MPKSVIAYDSLDFIILTNFIVSNFLHTFSCHEMQEKFWHRLRTLSYQKWSTIKFTRHNRNGWTEWHIQTCVHVCKLENLAGMTPFGRGVPHKLAFVLVAVADKRLTLILIVQVNQRLTKDADTDKNKNHNFETYRVNFACFTR